MACKKCRMAVKVIAYHRTLHNVFVLLQPDMTQPPMTFIGSYSMPLAWLASAAQDSPRSMSYRA